MLCKLTLLGSSDYPQTGGLSYSLTAETAYIFNTNRIRIAKAYETSDTEFEYVFDQDSRNASYAIFRVDGTIASLATTAETALDETLIPLTVLTDYDGDVLDSSETRYFHANEIFLCDEYDTDKTAVFVSMGGNNVKKFTVEESLDEIIALVTS